MRIDEDELIEVLNDAIGAQRGSPGCPVILKEDEVAGCKTYVDQNLIEDDGETDLNWLYVQGDLEMRPLVQAIIAHITTCRRKEKL